MWLLPGLCAGEDVDRDHEGHGLHHPSLFTPSNLNRRGLAQIISRYDNARNSHEANRRWQGYFVGVVAVLIAAFAGGFYALHGRLDPVELGIQPDQCQVISPGPEST